MHYLSGANAAYLTWHSHCTTVLIVLTSHLFFVHTLFTWHYGCHDTTYLTLMLYPYLPGTNGAYLIYLTLTLHHLLGTNAASLLTWHSYCITCPALTLHTLLTWHSHCILYLAVNYLTLLGTNGVYLIYLTLTLHNSLGTNAIYLFADTHTALLTWHTLHTLLSCHSIISLCLALLCLLIWLAPPNCTHSVLTYLSGTTYIIYLTYVALT